MKTKKITAALVIFSIFAGAGLFYFQYKKPIPIKATPPAFYEDIVLLKKLADKRDPQGKIKALQILSTDTVHAGQLESAAVLALGNYDDEEVFKKLSELLKKSNPILQTNALQALGKVRNQKRAELIFDFIKKNKSRPREQLYAHSALYSASTKANQKKMALDYLNQVAADTRNGLSRIAKTEIERLLKTNPQ